MSAGTPKKPRSSPKSTRKPKSDEALTSRTPTYGATIRCMELLLALLRAPHGRVKSELAEELGVSAKTVNRYTEILTKNVFGSDHQPIVVQERHGRRVILKVRAAEVGVDGPAHHAATMFLAVAALGSLRATDIGESGDALWQATRKKLPQRTRDALAEIERRFVYVPFAPKDYTNHNEVLDELFVSVLYRREIRVEYRRADGEASIHVFKPYSLVLYRDAIYVLGVSDRHQEPIYLAVERVDGIAKTGRKFRIPKDYNPHALSREGFGIWMGEEVEISLRLTGDAARQVPERLRHLWRESPRRVRGVVRLELKTRGWHELAWWILTWGADIEVVGPPAVREYVAEKVRGAAALYE